MNPNRFAVDPGEKAATAAFEAIVFHGHSTRSALGFWNVDVDLDPNGTHYDILFRNHTNTRRIEVEVFLSSNLYKNGTEVLVRMKTIVNYDKVEQPNDHWTHVLFPRTVAQMTAKLDARPRTMTLRDIRRRAA